MKPFLILDISPTALRGAGIAGAGPKEIARQLLARMVEYERRFRDRADRVSFACYLTGHDGTTWPTDVVRHFVDLAERAMEAVRESEDLQVTDWRQVGWLFLRRDRSPPWDGEVLHLPALKDPTRLVPVIEVEDEGAGA